MAIQLDWSTAEVSGGKLKVSLDDKPSDEWSASFERTLQLLPHATWPDIKLKKDSVTVQGLQEGSEEELRFFLESVVQEANGETSPEDSGASGEEESEESPEASGEEESDEDPDREMTDRFRAFGSAREPSESQESAGSGDS